MPNFLGSQESLSGTFSLGHSVLEETSLRHEPIEVSLVLPPVGLRRHRDPLPPKLSYMVLGRIQADVTSLVHHGLDLLVILSRRQGSQDCISSSEHFSQR